MKRHSVVCLVAFAILCPATCPLAAPAPAPVGVTREWSGAGGNAAWSNPANWVGNNVAGNGTFVNFPSSASAFTVVRDSTINLIGIEFLSGANGYQISGAGMPVDQNITQAVGAGSNTITAPISFTGFGTSSKRIEVAAGTLSLGNVVLPGSAATLDVGINSGATCLINGSIGGSAQRLDFFGGGFTRLGMTSTFDAPVSVQFSHILMLASGVVLNTAQPWTVGTDARVVMETGSAITSELRLDGDAVLWLRAPASSGSAAAQSLVLHPDASVWFEIGSAGESNRLVTLGANGPNLANAALAVVPTGGFTSSTGTQLSVIDPAWGTVLGEFAGLPEGGALAASNGRVYQISYHGGDGNAVVLTDNPDAADVSMQLRRQQPIDPSLVGLGDASTVEIGLHFHNSRPAPADLAISLQSLSGLGNLVWECQTSVGACSVSNGTGSPQTSISDLPTGATASIRVTGLTRLADRFLRVQAQAQIDGETQSRTWSEPLDNSGVFRDSFE